MALIGRRLVPSAQRRASQQHLAPGMADTSAERSVPKIGRYACGSGLGFRRFCRKFCRAGVSCVMMGPGLAGRKMTMDFWGSHFEREIVL
jgi:hypothetical protein